MSPPRSAGSRSTWTPSGARSSPVPSCIALGFYVRRKVTSAVPNKVQLLWEVIVGLGLRPGFRGHGPRYRHVVPFAVTIFLLVLTANWVELFPGLFHNTDWLPSPSADVNLTYALGAHGFCSDQRGQCPGQGVGRVHQGFFRQTALAGPDPRSSKS